MNRICSPFVISTCKCFWQCGLKDVQMFSPFMHNSGGEFRIGNDESVNGALCTMCMYGGVVCVRVMEDWRRERGNFMDLDGERRVGFDDDENGCARVCLCMFTLRTFSLSFLRSRVFLFAPLRVSRVWYTQKSVDLSRLQFRSKKRRD